MPPQIFQRRVRFQCALSYHQVYRDQGLENDGPCWNLDSGLERSEYLGDGMLSGVSSNEDMFDVLGLRGSILPQPGHVSLDSAGGAKRAYLFLTFTLVAPLTDFSYELAIVGTRVVLLALEGDGAEVGVVVQSDQDRVAGVTAPRER